MEDNNQNVGFAPEQTQQPVQPQYQQPVQPQYQQPVQPQYQQPVQPQYQQPVQPQYQQPVQPQYQQPVQPQYQQPVQPQYQQPVQPQYQQPVHPQYQQPVQPQYQQPVAPKDNSKLYCILSYIGILWLVGMFVSPENTNPKVRFHVNQGILCSIVCFAGGIVSFLLNLIEFTKVTYFGISISYTPWFISLLGALICLATLVFPILGIINVCTDKDVELPVIGKFKIFK